MRAITVAVVLFVVGALPAAASANDEQPPSIGTLNIDSQEAGDGAGCFFHVNEENAKKYVFVDRDGYGWMHLNGEIRKFVPVDSFVMWPSTEGHTLSRAYRADASRLELDVEVVAGCTEVEDDCPVRYGGTLSLFTEHNDTVLRVEGRCED